VRVKWDAPGEWPPSHKGPVVDYIAACNGPCSEAEPEALKFVKIAELGWIDASRDSGFWAADKLRDDDSSCTSDSTLFPFIRCGFLVCLLTICEGNINIPSGLKAGEYVLRTEIIALHVADLPEPFGAEFYPQCVSLSVTGDGDKVVSGGVVAESLYKPTDPGVNYTTLHDGDEHADYIIPGPAVWSGV
jgi:cellulase